MPHDKAPHNLYYPNNFSFLINYIIEAVYIPEVLLKIDLMHISKVVKNIFCIIKLMRKS